MPARWILAYNMWQGFVHRNHPVFVGITQQSDIKSTSQANWIPRIAGLCGKILRGKDGKEKKRGMDVEEG